MGHRLGRKSFETSQWADLVRTGSGRAGVHLRWLLTGVLLVALPVGAEEVCKEAATHGRVAAALAQVERSVDPCGETYRVANVLAAFARCPKERYRICVSERAERNFIERAAGAGEAAPSTITWNPSLRTVLELGCDGDPERAVRRDPTASLLHEIVHVVQDCNGLDPADHEFDALSIENIYRRARGLCQRSKYGDLPLPAAMTVSCDPGNCVCGRAVETTGMSVADAVGKDTEAADTAAVTKALDDPGRHSER